MFKDLIHKIKEKDRIAIARAISVVEDDRDPNNEILKGIFPYTGNAFRIGITGPPGAGKSSITDKLIYQFRKERKSVAVIGVDPSSPFTGGALLGDRIRMMKHHSDDRVFIRSMASRGGKGGLAKKTQEAGDIFDAAGYDVILFETVGVGQVELDVIQATDTVLVILVPESGDDIQMMKAGLMEIAHIFVINKADRDGANKLAITLTNILSGVQMDETGWRPEVLKTVATTGMGLDELHSEICHHRKHITRTGLWKQKLDERYTCQVKEQVVQRFESRFWSENHALMDEELAKPRHTRTSPYLLAERLLER